MSSSSSLQISIKITNVETNDKITFKVDGRLHQQPRTLKLCSNAKYKIQITCQPHADFHSFHFGGSDLELVGGPPNSGQYSALWNTTGIDPTKRGTREDLLFVLSGPSGTLRRHVQSKFYGKEDSHAHYGHKLEALIWKCSLDPATGVVTITDEEMK
ncbi:CB1 cannabinoid receptor-interacting protein 1 [Aphelenchoides fujianensis]|nr:CB1 cannabinoid receptor-interacting protein 1 [Aphelenchoides fujianensis]KAI6216246.1 CB1 cannabinoid receptor-interacting protein 1 [Aphelenchoides fujianensis]KAI6225450.1 CB1 cannabinoid receptor-interacting protein 1 [Aphelenchoides fujianensis]